MGRDREKNKRFLLSLPRLYNKKTKKMENRENKTMQAFRKDN
jgi:hypothetical protein